MRLLLVGLPESAVKQAKAAVGCESAKNDRSGAAKDPAGNDQQSTSRLAEALVAIV